MNLSFFISKRYLFAKKSRNVINLISGISVTGVMLGTMAFIIILFVVNGLETLVKSLVSPFDQDLQITINEGKVFSEENLSIKKIKEFPEVAGYAQILEENALFEYEDQQHIGVVKGVSDSYLDLVPLRDAIFNGKIKLNENNLPYAIVGAGVAYKLSLGINYNNSMKIWVPRRTIQLTMDASQAFNKAIIYPNAIFGINDESVDSRYTIVPLDFARKLLEYTTEISALEIKLKPDTDVDAVQARMQAILGDGFSVKNKFQQHEMLYKIMQSEKWATFFIIAFIMLILSFNVVSSLTMLIIDKKEDIVTLRNLGASNQLIRRIFLFEGWFISIIGAILGLGLGLIFSWLQLKFKLVKYTAGFLVDSYPIEIRVGDIILVFFTVIFIGFIAAWYPVRFIAKKEGSTTHL